MPSPNYRAKPCADCGCVITPRSSQTKRCPACAHMERKRLSREYQRRVAPKPPPRFLCVDCFCLCPRTKGKRTIRCATCTAERARQRASAWSLAHPAQRAAQRRKARDYQLAYLRAWRQRNREHVRAYNRASYHANPTPWLRRARRHKASKVSMAIASIAARIQSTSH